MDAKPLRLTRSKTVRDENQPIDYLPTKTLHQRNKSSPNLSSLAQAVTTKTAPKRAAFADVTNAQRGSGAGLKEAEHPKKSSLNVARNIQNETSRLGAPLQQPAQRPISISSIRSFFYTFGNNQQQNVVTRQETRLPTEQPIKNLARKPTTIFREHDEPASVKAPASDAKAEQEQPHATQVLPGQSQVELENDAAAKGDVLSAQALQDKTFEPLVVTDNALAADMHSAPNAIPAVIQPHPVRPTEAISLPNRIERRSNSSGLAFAAAAPEQWVGEHNVDVESDYTTARSLKSRGDCTTHQTTTILAPQQTVLAEQEIAKARLFVESSQEAIELEEDETWDTSMVTEYSEEIFSYMRELEESMRPNPHYMDNQTEVQWSMRSVLMDWLVQVHHRFSLLPETLFLCVNYIDRFLSCKVVSLGKLQLVGATAIFVAAKYEEINCPSVQEIVYMVDGGYTTDEILKAERFMLSMLGFVLGFPGPMSFLRRISKADDYDLESRTLAKYFMEITIMDERFVGCIPSYTAAGAHCLARLMLDKGQWSPKHIHYSGYTYSQLRPLLLTMLSCCDNPQKHHAAIFDKYSDKKFKRSSTFVQAELDNGFFLPAVQTRHSIVHEDTSSHSPYLFS